MTKYRILEVEGEIVPRTCHPWCLSEVEYVHKFIVQEIELTYIPNTSTDQKWDNSGMREEYKNLKEFTNLDAARAYKRSLELKEGIVHE